MCSSDLVLFRSYSRSSLSNALVNYKEKSSKLTEKTGQAPAQSGREIVYQYIQKQMKAGILLPGSVLDLQSISKALGISNTPLRDSLIRLEAEGYLTIYPRSKVVINTLELKDFPFLYEIMGSLEYTTISSSINNYTNKIILYMKKLNTFMRKAINDGDMMQYDSIHYEFHDIFFHVSSNIFAERILHPIKNRLWDFPRKNISIGWYHAAIDEHELIVDSIKKKKLDPVLPNDVEQTILEYLPTLRVYDDIKKCDNPPTVEIAFYGGRSRRFERR